MGLFEFECDCGLLSFMPYLTIWLSPMIRCKSISPLGRIGKYI